MKKTKKIKETIKRQRIKKNYLEWNNEVLASSIKNIDLNIILSIFLDIIFYVLSGALVFFWLTRLQEKMSALNLPQDVTALSLEQANGLASQVKSFYYLIILSFILLIVAIIFLASILKGAIWAKTTKTKVTFNLLSKFLGLNLMWMGFWIILILLISIFVQIQLVPMFMAVTIILALYFTNTLYTIFMQEQAFKSIPKSIKLSISQIHMFLLPYIIIFLVLFIIAKLSSYLNFKYAQVFIGIIIVLYLAFVRYYVSSLVLEVEKR